MTTSAEHLMRLARDDFKLTIVPAEQLVSLLVDVTVALAFRTGRTPSEILDGAYRTVLPDKEWRRLIEMDRVARQHRGEGE